MRRLFFSSVFVLSLIPFGIPLGCDSTGGSTNPEPSPAPGHPEAGEYQNPVATPVAADPSVIRAPDDTYYLYATQDAWANGQGSHYLPIFKSDNLVDWEFIGDVFEEIPAWGAGRFLWAPDISQRGDSYYLYYSYVQEGAPPCIGLATAQRPEGPWQDLGGPVFCSAEVGVPNSIDPFVWDDGQTRTMIWGSFEGIYAIELTENGTAPVGEKIQLADDRFEGAYMHHHDGYYYLFVSAGTCCEGANSTYKVYVGRSEALTGPYVDDEGIDLREGGGRLVLSASNGWVGPGHNSVATDDAGNDWIVYHAIPQSDPWLSNGVNHRPVLIDRITWQDGWPVVNDGQGPSAIPQPVPIVEGE